jgi:ribosomal protein S18 acetylase RimI-like enzyme
MPANVSKDEPLTVRNLHARDLDAVIALDARITGRRREEFFRGKLEDALHGKGIRVSLAAEADGAFAGFLLSRVFYGEFGRTEASAVLDTLGVHPAFRGRGVGRGLLAQLRTNLLAVGIARLHTEVSWDDRHLSGFFHREGFRPAPRICLDLDLEAHRERSALREASAAESP